MPKSENLYKFITLIFLVFILWFIYFLNPAFYEKIWQLSVSGDIDGTVEYLRSFGIWAIFISFILDVLVNCAGFLPSIFLSTANGVLFGIPMGILISWTAESIGVIISFFVMRFFLRDVAETVIKHSRKLQSLDDFSGEKGLVVMALARTLPYFPSGILTAFGAVSKMSIKDYVIATFIGKLPSTSIEVIIGHDVVNYKENIDRLAIISTSLVVFYIVLYFYNKKKKNK